MVLDDTPVPETVTVAERLEVDVFALDALRVIVPLLLPLVGDTLNHVALSFTVQLVFELIVNEPELPELLPKERLVVETDSEYDGFCPA